MKFIKDIIGEKRERVRLDGPTTAIAEPVQPPAEDTCSSAPLSLGHGFRLDPDPAADPAPAAAAGLPEEFGALQPAPAPLPQVDPEDGLDGLTAAAPDEDAIAAFFAREQPQAAEPAAQEYPDTAAFFDTPDDDRTHLEPVEAPEEDFYARQEAEAEEDEVEVEEDAADPFDADPDFSRLQPPEPAEDTAKPYRIFTRSNAAGRELDTGADDGEPAPAAPAPALQPELELARTQDTQQASILQPEPPARQAAPAPEPQPAPEAPPAAAPQAPAAAHIDVPAPSMGRGASRAGRVKTRLLGFSPAQAAGSDPFARSSESTAPGYTQFPVGWLAIVQGPGRGAAFTLFSGVTVIGRGEDQTVRLDFGDNSISRDNHAAIAFDPEQKAFFIGHGGKANLVRRNGRPVLSTEELSAGDVIRIGETTLRFVPLCGADFGWDQPQQSDTADAALR